MPIAEAAIETAARTLEAAGFCGAHVCAIVTGSGLGGLAERLAGRTAIPYEDIPGLPATRVSGHRGMIHRGMLADNPVLLFEGRIHAYERGDAAAMRVHIALARRLGAASLLLTSAAGGLRPEVGPGSLVAITDHLNLSGMNPLIGEPSDDRFVPMAGAYDPNLLDRLREAARAVQVPLHEGVYAWFSGPSFETPAEIRMAATLGADLVGMSTVPEVILARYVGLPVAAVSVVTNLATGVGGGDPRHAETKAVAAQSTARLTALVEAYIERLNLSRADA